MKRLSEPELEARINKFLSRKFSEFPQLKEDELEPDNAWREVKTKGGQQRSQMRLSIEAL